MPVVHGVLLGYVQRADADDLSQDVFETAMHRLPELREAAAFPGWIVSIARRAARDAKRRVAPVTGFDAGPVIARMETLRRAAIYASRDGAVARGLASRLEARIATVRDADARALALFDAGYFAETLQDIVRLQGYDMPGIGPIDAAGLRAILKGRDGSARIERALALRPGDPSLRFAAALVAAADDRKADIFSHARFAAAATAKDDLLARNIGQITD